MLRARKYTVLVVVLIILVSLNVLINFEKGELVDKQAVTFSKLFYKNNNKIINPHDYKYILNVDKDICMPSKKLTLLAMVTSASNNFENRKAIRKTWANAELFPGLETVFMIGKSLNETVNELIVEESNKFGDIVQEDFMDTYKNLTTKTVMSMKWAANYCNSTKFFLKVDDDMIVNSYALLPFLEVYPQPVTDSLLCLPNMHAKVDRNVTSKFYMSEKEVIPDYYPPYCNGGAYLISPDMPQKLFTVSLFTKLFLFEDVYIGLLMKKLSGTIVSLRENYCWSEARCYYGLHRSIEKIYFFFLNGLTSERILAGWLEVTEKMMEVIAGNIRPEPKFL